MAGSTTTFDINALGQRVRKGSTWFAFDESGRIIGEYGASGTLVQETVWLDDLPVATLRPNGTAVDIFYVHPDHLGTPRAVTRASDNQLAWRWDNTEPFGNSAPSDNPSGLGTFAYNLRFSGQYYDAETGTHYNYLRDYDPRLGRYIESDAIGLLGGISTFGYVGGAPLSQTDTLGLAYGNAVGQAQFHFGEYGATGKFSIGADSKGQICFQITTCGRLGVGASIGLSCGVEASNDNFKEGDSGSMGFWGNIGTGVFGSGSLSMNGRGKIKASGTLGGGYGIAVGSQVCATRTFCMWTR